MEKIENNENLTKPKRRNFKINSDFIIVFIFSLIFFVLASVLPYFQNQMSFVKFFSPDENANYVFTKLYQESGELFIFEKYNIIAQEIIHPRSYFSYEGNIKPLSFLGIIIIYGSLAKVFGVGIIPFLTPFFAALGLFFYYLLARKFFGRRTGFISFFILFFFPVLLYYSARSMFHNVLFLSFLIIGLYFLTCLLEKGRIKKDFLKVLPEKKDNDFRKEDDLKSKNSENETNEILSDNKEKLLSIKKGKLSRKYYHKIFKFDFIFSALAGLFFGLAISVRASELVWLAPAGLLLLILQWKKLSFFRVAIFISFIFLGMAPVLYHNQILYDSPFYGGYYEMNKSIEDISIASGSLWTSFLSGYFFEAKNSVKAIFNTVFYFGFYPRQSLEMFNKYCVEMFWYIFWPAVFGFAYLLIWGRKTLRKIWRYGLAWSVLSIILILYYGSWKFVDNPDPSRFTIGNSYTRYWLPIYIGLIFLSSVFINSLSEPFKFFKNKKFYNFFSIFIPFLAIVGIGFLSLSFVYKGSEEGLKHYPHKAEFAKYEFEQVLALTEDNAIIITEYHDKFFFPERKVIVGRFNDNNMNRNYRVLAERLPVYYYNFKLPEIDMEYLNDRRLLEFSLGIELVEDINETFSLYRIIKY